MGNTKENLGQCASTATFQAIFSSLGEQNRALDTFMCYSNFLKFFIKVTLLMYSFGSTNLGGILASMIVWLSSMQELVLGKLHLWYYLLFWYNLTEKLSYTFFLIWCLAICFPMYDWVVINIILCSSRMVWERDQLEGLGHGEGERNGG